MIQDECENRGLEVTDDGAWEPLRTYQAKLEKLTQKATAERVALEAAQAREKEQEAKEQDDAIMTAFQDGPEATEELETSAPAPKSNGTVQGNGSGKKRLATPEDDNVLETEGADDEIQQQQSRASSVGRSGSDAESETGSSSRVVKETKRIRVQ